MCGKGERKNENSNFEKSFFLGIFLTGGMIVVEGPIWGVNPPGLFFALDGHFQSHDSGRTPLFRCSLHSFS